MGLGTNGLTTTSESAFVAKMWSKETQRQAEAAKVMANLVKDYSNQTSMKGDTIHYQTISNLTATAKAVNTQVSLQAPSETDNTISINRYFESSFLVEKSLAVQTQFDVMTEYTSKAAESIERQKDSDLTGLYSSLTQAVGGLGGAVTEANFVRCIQYLDDANAPQDDRHFVIRPVAKADLLKINKFTGITVGADATSPGTVRTMNIVANGLFGELYGVQVHVTTQVAADATTATLYHNLVFHREAFTLAEQISTTSETQYKQEYIGTLHSAYGLWGRAVYRGTFGVDFRSS